jgi:hypothetical protein
MSDPEQLHPESGARLLFELDEAAGGDARYAIAALLPDAVRHDGSGQVALGTELVEVSGLDEAPDWVRTLAARFLRQIAAGQRKRSEPRWPRRVLRWRDR